MTSPDFPHPPAAEAREGFTAPAFQEGNWGPEKWRLAQGFAVKTDSRFYLLRKTGCIISQSLVFLILRE